MDITANGVKGLFIAVIMILVIIIALIFIFNLLVLVLPFILLIFVLGYVYRLFHTSRKDKLKEIYKDVKFKVK